MEKCDTIKQGLNRTDTRVLIDLYILDERISLRNSLRKHDGKQWASAVPSVDVYTFDPEFVINRSEPMISTRSLLAAKLWGYRSARSTSTSMRASSSSSRTARSRDVVGGDGAGGYNRRIGAMQAVGGMAYMVHACGSMLA